MIFFYQNGYRKDVEIKKYLSISNGVREMI